MDFQNYIDSRLLFSVPIYFREEEEHIKFYNELRKKIFAQQERYYNRFALEITAQDRIRWELDFEKYCFHIWKYTEIIGYIEFRKKGNSIFAFVYLPDAKRFRPLMNGKKFIISRDFPDYNIELDEKPNELIVQEIYSILEVIGKSSRRFKRYYIDTSELNNFVNLINFHHIKT